MAFYAVDGDPTSKKFPDPPASIAAILTGLGKPKRTAQFVCAGCDISDRGSHRGICGSGGSCSGRTHQPHPHKIPERHESAHRAYWLAARPATGTEAWQSSRGASGPLKPTLVEAFKPRGYDCRGGSGTFSLRRRTTTNHVVEVELDVGTWSRSLTFMLHVHGPGFIATLMPPVLDIFPYRNI